MSDIIKIENLQEMIIEIRGQRVLLDSDVAAIYGVETKRVNEAVKNNPEKFPHAYMIALDSQELEDLRSKFSTAKFSKMRVLPNAFTEKGLYMLATILKSSAATRATLTLSKPSRRFGNCPATSNNSPQRRTRLSKRP